MSVPALPPIEIKPSRMAALYLGTLLVIPVLFSVVLPLVQGEDLGSGAIYGTVGYWCVLLVVGGSVIGLMLRRQRQTRARLLAEAPAGTVLATLARPFEVEESADLRRPKRFAGWSNGVLVIGADGITFREQETNPATPEVRLAWSEIDQVVSERENPFRLYLVVHTRTRQLHGWQVPGAPVVEAALRELQA